MLNNYTSIILLLVSGLFFFGCGTSEKKEIESKMVDSTAAADIPEARFVEIFVSQDSNFAIDISGQKWVYDYELDSFVLYKPIFSTDIEPRLEESTYVNGEGELESDKETETLIDELPDSLIEDEIVPVKQDTGATSSMIEKAGGYIC